MSEMCTDNRLELIEKYRAKLIESTNIETAQDEMAVIDSILLRLWQIGWLDRLEEQFVKLGKWIDDAETYYKSLNEKGLGVDEYTPYFTDDIACSECLAKYSVLDNETQFFKFCPNCGARMECDHE